VEKGGVKGNKRVRGGNSGKANWGFAAEKKSCPINFFVPRVEGPRAIDTQTRRRKQAGARSRGERVGREI